MTTDHRESRPRSRSYPDRGSDSRKAGPQSISHEWSDEEDVIERANDTRYGLGASVWGKDQATVERIGGQLDAGTVWLNEIHQYSPYQAFGGHKESGIGCENSLHGLMEYTNWHTITLNKNWGKGTADKAA